MEQNKVTAFTDLNAWKIGHELVMEIYRETKCYPKEEIFGLTNQIRRAAVSITSNIAEGFSRRSKKEKSQFYSISLGSLTEVQNQLIVSKDIKYISCEFFEEIFNKSITVQKLICGLIKSAETKIQK